MEGRWTGGDGMGDLSGKNSQWASVRKGVQGREATECVLWPIALLRVDAFNTYLGASQAEWG